MADHLTVLELKDVDTQDTLQDWSVANFVEYLRQPPEQRVPQHVYAKDVTCPSEWALKLNNILPTTLTSMGDKDLMGN
jgi:hypothetical protein